MQGKTRHAVGLACGGDHAPQDVAMLNAWKKQGQHHWDQGRKEVPHEDIEEMQREDQSPKQGKQGLSRMGGP